MKIAVIGAGNWGKNLVRTFHQLGVLSAVVESEEARRGKLTTEYPGVAVVSDASKLKELGIGAVAIATPASTHFALAKAALESGMDVFVEKPITLATKEAEELTRLAKDKSRVLMVGHLLLYQPAIRWIASFLKEGGLGRVYSLHQERLNLGKVRSVENALWSLGVHDIAVLLNLVGTAPTSIEASGQPALQSGVEDDIYVHLGFPGGVQAHLHTSWLWPEKSRKLTIVGEKGMLVFDELKQTVAFHKKQIAANLDAVDGGVETVFQGSDEPLKLELTHFLERIADRQAPVSDGQSGVEVLRVMETASQALRKTAPTPGAPAPTTAKKEFNAHESAYIDAGSQIGKGTRIWHFSHVSADSVIGESCSLGQNVFVAKNVNIGNHVKIQNNVSLYEGVTLEDYVFCGPSMVFTNVRTPRSAFPRNTSADYHPTLLRKGSSIGANATIVCGTTVGEWAFVAAGAVVTKDVPNHALIAGVPGKIIGWACECGATLKFEADRARCSDCRKGYEKTGATTVRRTE